MTTGDDNSFLLDQAKELEEILEFMPNDVGTLNSLVYTYLQLGIIDTASEFALELRSVLTASGETEQLQSLAVAYLDFAPDNQVFIDLAGGEDKASASIPVTPTLEDASLTIPDIVIPEMEFDLGGGADISLNELCVQLNYELDLGELLKKEELITENICDQAVENLIQHSSSSMAITLTLLSELINIQYVNMEKIYGGLSQKTNMPFIKLSQFEISDDLLAPFDIKIIKRLGIVPFSKFQNEIMIAILNPLDVTLKETLESYLGTKLHFYLTSVEEVDKFYEKAMS